MTDAPKTLLDAVRYFSDIKVCNEYMKQVKWPDGVITCPKCNSEKVGEIASRNDHLRTYVRNRVHVNGMENYFSLLKRSIRGTYVWCAAFHLQRYVDEQAFRFNHRKTNDLMRFVEALCGVVGKRLTYRVLTAQDDAGFMGIK